MKDGGGIKKGLDNKGGIWYNIRCIFMYPQRCGFDNRKV